MFYYHTDHLGSTRLVTDPNRNIVSAILYHPFGEPSLKEGSEDYLFTGKEKDETGLYCYGARYYDPETGRFISKDLLSGQMKTPQTLNRYTYVLNNPLKYRDPDGFEEAGALLGKSDYPGQGSSFESGYIYVYWSHNPSWIGTDQWTGNYTCLFAMAALATGTILIVPVWGAAAAWWGTLSGTTKDLIKIGITYLISEGINWIRARLSEDERFVTIEFEWGYWIYDNELNEYILGEKWIDSVHQIWVHIPGEGELGGHWEDDLDCDGVASSVDDDDTDPEVGDEDPEKP
jgi:RHS repeat-associated protein